MKKSNAFMSTLCAGVLSVASLGHSGTSAAAELRLAPSAFCQPQEPAMELFGVTVERTRRTGPRLKSEWGTNVVVCGFPSGSSLPHQNVNELKIRGYRGNKGDFTAARVRACVGTFTGKQLCGYNTYFGDGGNFTATVEDLSKWKNVYFYPYLLIEMQPGDRLNGIVAAD